MCTVNTIYAQVYGKVHFDMARFAFAVCGTVQRSKMDCVAVPCIALHSAVVRVWSSAWGRNLDSGCLGPSVRYLPVHSPPLPQLWIIFIGHLSGSLSNICHNNLDNNLFHVFPVFVT